MDEIKAFIDRSMPAHSTHTITHAHTHAALDIVYEHDESTARTSYINKHLDKAP